MERVKDEADPLRCKGAAPDGQCWNKSEDGSDFCRAHGGRNTALGQAKTRYILVDAQRRARLAELNSNSEAGKSLQEEIDLTTMLVEARLNHCKTNEDFVNASGQVNSLMLTLERLKKSSLQIEQHSGNLIHKSAVLKLAQLMSQIVIEELEHVEGYEEIVDRINQRLIGTISKANNAEVPAIAGPTLAL